MPESIVIYTRFGAYEPGNRYYLSAPAGGAAGNIAAGLADAQSYLQTTNVTIVRWEHLASSGARITGGALNVPGKFLGEFSEFRYCALIRFNSGGPEKPSTKFVHPLPEGALANGIPTSGWNTAVQNFEDGILPYDVADSDGVTVGSVSFLRGTRRRNVRIAA